MGSPVWSHDGMIAVGNAHKDKVCLLYTSKEYARPFEFGRSSGMDAAIDGRFFWMLTGSVNTGNPFRESSAWNGKRRVSWKIEDGLRRVESERDGLEEILKRPTAGEMNADATGRLTEASADLCLLYTSRCV